MDRWPQIAELLDAQHGLVSAAQLRELKLSRHTLARWVQERRLVKCGPGVMRLVGARVTWEQQLMCGLLSLGDSAAVSHGAAARLHGFDRSATDDVEFLVGRAKRNSRLEGTVHSSALIGKLDIVTVDGFRTTSATRTILDLANIQVHPDRLRAAIDSAVRLQLSAPEAIRRRLEDIRRRGRTGVRMIDELLLDAGGHTMLEREFLRLMREAGLPRPQTQVVFRDGKRTMARVDFRYAEWRNVVEVSGRIGHSSPAERARDEQRRNVRRNRSRHRCSAANRRRGDENAVRSRQSSRCVVASPIFAVISRNRPDC
ncbi:MAG TPA: type IV toxin-antitoxin system AbiEi family antitoxin domain-containing protein [Ilumatobacter sp.]